MNFQIDAASKATLGRGESSLSYVVSSKQAQRLSHIPSLFNLENDLNSIKRETPNRHRRRKRQAPHKFLEMALVADNFAIAAYGEDDMTMHLLTLAHIVSPFLLL